MRADKEMKIKIVRKAYDKVFNLLLKHCCSNTDLRHRLHSAENRLDALSTKLRKVSTFDPCKKRSCNSCKYLIKGRGAQDGMCNYVGNVRENGDWIGFVKAPRVDTHDIIGTSRE
jgi:RNA polymerase subunit RPABC4/transcription elongation factor Spt4